MANMALALVGGLLLGLALGSLVIAPCLGAVAIKGFELPALAGIAIISFIGGLATSLAFKKGRAQLRAERDLYDITPQGPSLVSIALQRMQEMRRR